MQVGASIAPLLRRVFCRVLCIVDSVVDLLSGLLSRAFFRTRTRREGDRCQGKEDDDVAQDLHAGHCDGLHRTNVCLILSSPTVLG